MALAGIGVARTEFSPAVPGDLSVVGFDGIGDSGPIGAEVTSFSQPVALLAREAISLLGRFDEEPQTWTAPEALAFTRALMADVGQSPIVLAREIEGFVLNRLQGALLREAWALYEDGVASVPDIDRTVSEGLGLRWSFMGPFETIDLNAAGGIADYARRLSPLYARIAASRIDHAPWSSALVVGAERERREILSHDDLAERAAWRDRRLMALEGRSQVISSSSARG